MKECPTFYGLDPQWFKADRLYRIYITHDCLCGAYIAGQIYDEQSAAIQLQSFRFLLSGVLKRTIECRKEREDRYDAMVPAGESFLGEDKRNFRIDRHQVVRITVKRNRSLWTPLNVGTVRIEFGDGSNRRFILVGDQDADVIADSMKRFFAEGI